MAKRKQVQKETLEYFKGDDLAANVWVTKYALTDSDGDFLEATPDDMHRRLAQEFARMETKFGGPRALSEESIYQVLKDFKYVVPQGSPMMGIGNNNVNVSLSNCVVVKPPSDSLSSIMDSGKELANLFKRRCGVGVDLSHLRPDGASVNNSAGTTTGAWSFADFYSYVCRMIGQNGRRGALMITMDVRHPDIEQFVTMKHNLTKVTGANVSVKISDDFMEAVEKGGTFELRFPIDSKKPTFTKKIKARELWDVITDSATKTAEPGLMMWDNIINNLPAHSYSSVGFETVTTNPCGEVPLSPYDSCRLISINLKHFVKNAFSEEANFDFEHFTNIASVAMRLSDDLVELELEKLENIISVCDTDDEKKMWSKMREVCQKGRRTGLGTHGLADALARMKLPYDSEEAVSLVEQVYSTLRNSAYAESISLATERGAFPAFDWELEKDNKYIQRLPEDIKTLLAQHGRRNISILTNAPTGSVSILSQTSSGLEPVFRNSYKRRRKLSHNENNVRPDFVDEMGDKWAEYEVLHHNVQEWRTLQKAPDAVLPDFFVTSDKIDWSRRIALQAAIQKNVDHSISSTINLPAGTSPDTVSSLYRLAWKMGLKGVTVYVDGSRSGVLVAESTQAAKEQFSASKAFPRPEVLDCDIHHTTIKGEKWTILVGLLDGKPYEVMGGLSNLIEIPKSLTKGLLTKVKFKTKNNRYDLEVGKNGDAMVVRDIVKIFDNPDNSSFTRMFSLALRHGAKPSFLVEQLQKDKDSNMFSFARCVSRILKNYIQNGEKVESTDFSTTCCQEPDLVYQDGCVTCVGCGYSKCG